MFHYMFTAESDGERILKIGKHLAKLWARVGCPVFLTHGVIVLLYHQQ